MRRNDNPALPANSSGTFRVIVEPESSTSSVATQVIESTEKHAATGVAFFKLPLSDLPSSPAVAPPEDPVLSHGLPGGLVVISASTGGPLALREPLSCIPHDYPGAIVVVQHMPASVTSVLAYPFCC
jgi:chemotaxis response regulator CheB